MTPRFRELASGLRTLPRRIVALPLAFLASVVWLLFGPFVLYPPHTTLDPWFYTGYFLHFSHLLNLDGFTYYVSRISWILPGLLAFKIFSPQVASLLLSAAMMGTGAASLYWIVRWHYGRLPALVAAAVLVANPYYLSTLVWLYPDGPAIAYAMVALALFVRPFGNRAGNTLFGAAALTFSGLANMSGAPMILGVLAIPFWYRRHSRRELVAAGVQIAAGVSCAAVVLMLASRISMHQWNPFWPQIQIFLYSMQHPEWLRNLWGDAPFLDGAKRLFLPLFVLVFGAVLLRVRRKPSANTEALYLGTVVCCGIYSFQQFVQHSIVLRVPTHSSYMLVVVLGFTAVAIGELLSDSPPKYSWLMLAAALLCPIMMNVERLRGRSATLWSLLAILGVLAVRAAWVSSRAACLLLVIGVFLGPALDLSFDWVWNRQGILHSLTIASGPRADSFAWLMQLESWIQSRHDGQTRIRFWWDDEAPGYDMLDSAAALYLDRRAVLAEAFSAPGSDELRQHLSPKVTLVYLSRHPERIPERLSTLTSRGFTISNGPSVTLPFHHDDIRVTLYEVAPARGSVQ